MMDDRSKSECEVPRIESDFDTMLDFILKSYIFVGQLHLRSINFKIKYNMVLEQAHSLRPRLYFRCNHPQFVIDARPSAMHERMC